MENNESLGSQYMKITYAALPLHLKKTPLPFYLLTGSEPYLLNDAACLIKNAWNSAYASETQIIHVQSPKEWAEVFEAANNYSLFTDYQLIDVRTELKSIDSAGLDYLRRYLSSPNLRCLLMIRAPLIPLKSLTKLEQLELATIVHLTTLAPAAQLRFITQKLQENSLHYENNIPALISQYTQGNLLTAVQLITKLALVTDPNTTITYNNVTEYLSFQAEYQLYELAEAILSQQDVKALYLIRQAATQRVEPTLILWLLTQEIRLLIQLMPMAQESFANACKELKIWPQKTPLYQQALKRFSKEKLHALLYAAQKIDEHIKSTNGYPIWNALEKLSMEVIHCKI